MEDLSNFLQKKNIWGEITWKVLEYKAMFKLGIYL